MSKIEELRAASITARRLVAVSDTDKAGGERRWIPLATAERIVTEQEQRIEELEKELEIEKDICTFRNSDCPKYA